VRPDSLAAVIEPSDGPASWTWSDHYEQGTAGSEAVQVKPVKARDSQIRNMMEWTYVIVGALGIALLIRAFLLASFFIPSVSMVPTLKVGDRVLVNKLSYRLHDVHRQDVIVFERPPGEPDLTIKDLIKRVIGIPGDMVSFKDGKVFVNGEQLDEPYLAPGMVTAAKGADSITVPAGQVLVLGDNRTNSFDGRSFGTFDQKLIVGRAFVIVWPFSNASRL
jgi:signal peptidase I